MSVADPTVIEFDVRTDEMLVNMGPQHPSTHGVLRLVLRTDGEVISEVVPHLGYLHRCAEKIGENVTPIQFMPYTDRMDYLAAMNMNLGYSLAVEKLAGMKTTKKAPTNESRSTTAVPPPNAASARTPDPAPMGIASVSPTIARMRRSSLTASRRSRAATSAALRRSNFGQITMVVHNREVDVLQRRHLAHLLAHLQTGAAA